MPALYVSLTLASIVTSSILTDIVSRSLRVPWWPVFIWLGFIIWRIAYIAVRRAIKHT